MTSDQDYFDLPKSYFTLSSTEKQAIQDAIVGSGRMLINSEVTIIDPTINRFIINITIRYFDGCDKNSIRTDVKSKLSTYFLNINRNDIIPLSDIISIVEKIDGVDTCDVFFINEQNENAIINGKYIKTETTYDNLQQVIENKLIYLKRGTDPRLGFDSFGNIIVDKGNICIPKGGWMDRDGNYYTETPETGKLGPINIFFLDKVEYSSYNQSMQRKLLKLLNNN